MSGAGGGREEIDPEEWIRWVGIPMAADVQGLKRAIWWAAGAATGIGVLLGLLAPLILKKLGLSA